MVHEHTTQDNPMSVTVINNWTKIYSYKTMTWWRQIQQRTDLWPRTQSRHCVHSEGVLFDHKQESVNVSTWSYRKQRAKDRAASVFLLLLKGRGDISRGNNLACLVNAVQSWGWLRAPRAYRSPWWHDFSFAECRRGIPLRSELQGEVECWHAMNTGSIRLLND